MTPYRICPTYREARLFRRPFVRIVHVEIREVKRKKAKGRRRLASESFRHLFSTWERWEVLD